MEERILSVGGVHGRGHEASHLVKARNTGAVGAVGEVTWPICVLVSVVSVPFKPYQILQHESIPTVKHL